MLNATLKLLLANRTCKIKLSHVRTGGVFIISELKCLFTSDFRLGEFRNLYFSHSLLVARGHVTSLTRVGTIKRADVFPFRGFLGNVVYYNTTCRLLVRSPIRILLNT